MAAQLSAHDQRNFVGTSAGYSCTQWSEASRSGKRRHASAVGRVQARREASEVEPMGPIVLDRPEDDLERLEIRSRDREAGNRNRVAAHTIQTILVEVVPAERAGATARKFGDSEAGPNHGYRQRDLGRTSDPRGTPQTRIRDLGANRFQTHAEKEQDAFANMENVSAQSCRPTRFRGLLHSGNDSITRAVCFCRAGP